MYETRLGKEVLCVSSAPFLGYSVAILNDMEKAGVHLYKDGKREKPPRIGRSGSGEQNKPTGIIPEKKGKVK
jgi:hypothetical protein